jgi:hypothetical protein
VTALLTPDGTAARTFQDAHMIHACKKDRCEVPDATDPRGWRCKYGYPFEVNEVTVITDTKRVQLRRRAQDAMVVSTDIELALESALHIETEFISELTPGITTYITNY